MESEAVKIVLGKIRVKAYHILEAGDLPVKDEYAQEIIDILEKASEVKEIMNNG